MEQQRDEGGEGPLDPRDWEESRGAGGQQADEQQAPGQPDQEYRWHTGAKREHCGGGKKNGLHSLSPLDRFPAATAPSEPSQTGKVSLAVRLRWRLDGPLAEEK